MKSKLKDDFVCPICKSHDIDLMEIMRLDESVEIKIGCNLCLTIFTLVNTEWIFSQILSDKSGR